MQKKLSKSFRYVCEALLILPFYGLFRIMPFPIASACGGWMGRSIGPYLRVHHKAKYNLQRAFPDKNTHEIDTILQGMWDNLGRVVGEFSHIPSFEGKKFQRYVTLSGSEYVEAALNTQRPLIIASGHFGNWELGPRTLAEIGHPAVIIYREANNLWVDKLFRASRKHSHAGMYPKGRASIRAMFQAMKETTPLAMLVDQKMNDGIAVPLMGHPAMTSNAIAHLVRKSDAIVIMGRCVRVDKHHFQLFLEAPLVFADTSDTTILNTIHQTLERWITQHPEQWFWVHQRWGKIA